MIIDLPEELIKRLRTHLKETKNPQPIEFFIEECVDYSIENYPWSYGDICVHNEACMHCKSVYEWRNEK